MSYKILVPHDLSPLADDAVEWAARLVRSAGGSLVLVHIVALIPAVMAPMPVIPPPSADELERFRQQLAATATRYEVPAEAHVVLAADVGAEVVARAKSTNADLVVMGTHGRGGIKRAVLGSVADYVVRHSDCPVVTIRSGMIKHEEPTK